MGVVVDSSVFIAAERGKLDLERVLRDHGDEPIVIAVTLVVTRTRRARHGEPIPREQLRGREIWCVLSDG